MRVHAGSDPLIGMRHDPTEVVPPGPVAAVEAEKVRPRLLNQVDEQRNPPCVPFEPPETFKGALGDSFVGRSSQVPGQSHEDSDLW